MKENSKYRLKQALRDQLTCDTCKYGSFVRDENAKAIDNGHCTRWSNVADVEPKSKCGYWEPMDIDKRTIEEFKKFREQHIAAKKWPYG